ncbi:cation transporter [Atopobacter sp. AH10]|uniref:cation diffusion facilitator family transporter n=1 Tax=Atopobacter sp. AH10 TaxID=2315861 RepID=UPI000EF1C469|nr:cation diffusion facilitator family transporter [Atopobacter sp. AH10]RLK62818.1 cation transporter [Atopobacter sp. AH10]
MSDFLTSDSDLAIKNAEKGAKLSLLVYMIMAVAKILVGFIFHSHALQADGFNNCSDTLSSITIMAGLKLARKPVDSDHAYGHYKYEPIASLITSIFMLFIGFSVLSNAMTSFTYGPSSTLDSHPLTILVAFLSAIVIFSIYLYNMRLARQTNSKGLKAAAKDNLSDALISLATALSLIGARYGFLWLDPVMALLVSIIILKTAIEIFKEAVFDLTDGFKVDKLESYEATVFSHPAVSHVDSIKARVYGSKIYMDVTISVDPELNVRDSHHITEEIEKMLAEKHHISFVDIHVEPDDIPDAPEKYQ